MYNHPIDTSRIRVAILVCSRVIGGHEYQVAALAQSLSSHVSVSVYVNQPEHVSLFNALKLDIHIKKDLLLQPGRLVTQCLDGLRRRNSIRSIVESHDYVIVSAGAVEAAIAVGIALRGFKPMSMYLPFFYDRVAIWGWIGYFYNCILAKFCRLFGSIIAINRIQAKVIRAFSGVPIFVVNNKIREVKPPLEQGPARLVFVGRLDQQKRVDELMSWLDTEANPIKELILIGEGPLRSQLEQLAKKHIYLKCKFLGWRLPDEQDRLIRSTDILVLNSLLEGEPLVVREARARGMNIVVRNIIGTRGVTSPAERFSTQGQLLLRLSTIANQEAKNKSTILIEQLKNEESRRENQIELILSVIIAQSTFNPKI